ncbi:hypothetical protein [Acinetobacter sp. P1(2025)]|uniref:hypothetical protein n=1 Tax=Acinetobacter sp. P1(2025) TaxID=3446120 RepID=UPI003F53C88D
MKEVFSVKNMLRAIVFPVIFGVISMIFINMIMPIANLDFIGSSEQTKFNIIFPIFCIFAMVGVVHISMLITYKLIPENKEIDTASVPRAKSKITLKDCLVLGAIGVILIAYSLIFSIFDLSTMQTVVYLLFGMFLISFITIFLRFYAANREKEKTTTDEAP